MIKRTIGFSTLILSIVVFCASGNAIAIEGGELAHKIAFLRNGEVWVCNKNGRGVTQITRTNGRIENFLFSPTLEFLAYSKIIKYVDEPGLWEKGEKVPQRAVCSIVILQLRTQKILKEIPPPNDNWIYLARWLPDKKLLCYESSGFDVSGFFECDIREGVERQLEYARGSILSNADFHPDGSLMVYTDYSGIGEGFRENLHMVNLKSNDDKILLSEKSIEEPTISSDRRKVAFVQVTHSGKQSVDGLWILTIKDGSLEKLYEGPAKPKIGGKSELAWSFDDRHIGMFFSPETIVLEIQNPGNIHKISGADFNWIENAKIIFARGSDIYLYNLGDRKTEIFLKDASKPIFLWKR